MPTVETAAVAAATYVALFAGHHLGDHPLQSPAAAAGKGAPSPTELSRGVSPWRGWSWCLRHVLVYTAVQAICLALVAMVAPVGLIGVLAALIVSASSHAVIDRRWVVQWFLAAKRADDWSEGPYLVDQSLHLGLLLVAAVAAASVRTPGGLAVVACAGAALVAAALVVERRRAAHATAAPRAVSAHR